MSKFSGERLRYARLAAGLRPEHVAVAICRSVDSVRGYETGRIDPPASLVAKLAAAVGTEPGELFAADTEVVA